MYAEIRRGIIIWNFYNDTVSIVGGANASVSPMKRSNTQSTVNQDLVNKVEETGFLRLIIGRRMEARR